MCLLERYKGRKVKLNPEEAKKLKKTNEFEILWKIIQNRFMHQHVPSVTEKL